MKSTTFDNPDNYFWIGVNFWSSSGGPLMWHHYDPEIIRTELSQLTENGCNMTRSFLYWPHFVPYEHTLDEEVLNRFKDFLDAHLENNLVTIPTFIVGHMSGENWDPSWRNARDLYRDTTMVAEQGWFAHEIAERFKDHPSISGWLISNEMPLYGGRDASHKEIYAWTQAIIYAIRAAGAKQPISVGDGAWGVEMTGVENGFSIRSLKELVDFIGPHVYPMQNDEIRQFLYAAYTCSMATGFDLPVVMEEFGVTSDFASDENAAIYYRHLLYSTLLAGSRGWIAWNNCDYDNLYTQPPYRHHPFELHFGLIDSQGNPKPQMNEFSAFAKFIKKFQGELTPVKGQAAIVVPEHFETIFPFTEESVRSDMSRHMLQAYAIARLADLNIEMTREKDGFPGNHLLYIMPSTKILTTTGVTNLESKLKSGAALYLSYFGGSTDNQRGPWIPWLNRLFGVKQKMRYGLAESITDDVIQFKFVKDMGNIKAGQILNFTPAATTAALSYLPIDVEDTTQVIAIDQNGMPAITSYSNGTGTSFLCTYPLEHFAANVANDNPNNICTIYQAVAIEVGLTPQVYTDDCRITIGSMKSSEYNVFIAANLTSDTVEATMNCLDNQRIVTLEWETLPKKMTFLPYEIVVFALTKSD